MVIALLALPAVAQDSGLNTDPKPVSTEKQADSATEQQPPKNESKEAVIQASEGEKAEETKIPAGTAVDKEGNPIQETDKDGKPVFDDEGNPVYKKVKPPKPNNSFLFIIIGVFVLMMFMGSRGKKKQQRKHVEMMESLKKGDRVVSIGGIIGTLVEVKETEVVVKISDNTRMRMTKGAIRAAGPEVEEAKAQDAAGETK
ncbi:MAG: preprotein translocase subunit YajC [Phycisphaerales bacterium]|nr:preprotein translocase subunit YajC [Phycisphaerales bacterium]MBT7170366.1 preprotein translocase subunit YajC [Phycisphaerales bacterium]